MIRRGIGVQSYVSSAIDDAQAFIDAAGITDATQQSAIRTLVTDLKSFGIWEKMKAIYPFVGGTASSHRWNLRDPRDLDAAFRLVFSGGATHSLTGYLPNGVNGFADTRLNENTVMTLNNQHISFYSRSNTTKNSADISVVGSGTESNIYPRFSNDIYGRIQGTSGIASANTDSRGLYLANRTNNTQVFVYKNTTKYTVSSNTVAKSNAVFTLGAVIIGGGNNFSDRELAFASIGDGLTDTESTNLYTAVQKYQTTLGRQVGVPIVADSDAQAFLNAAEITDITQANAVDKLVTDLKGFGIWSKMRAIYPFVGGTASSHRFNLKDPRDLDAAFRLVFSGGATHSLTGYLPNGVNGFADTFYSPTAQTSITNTHASLYLRTGSVNPQVDFGSTDDVSYTNRYFMNYYYDSNSYFDLRSRLTIPNASIGGLVGHVNMVRTATNLMKAYKNGNVVGTNTNSSLVYGLPSSNLYLSALNFFGTAISFQNRQLAFATFGDGITDTEAANLYTAIQQYQTTLSRNV